MASRQLPRPLFLLIGGLCLAAFFTGTSLVAGVANTISPFELIFVLLFGLTLFWYAKYNLKVLGHPVIVILGLILLAAVASILNLSDRLFFAAQQLFILLYIFLFTLTLYNLMRLDNRALLPHLLRWFAYATVPIVIWVVIGVFSASGYVSDDSVGPFKARAHMGYYMLTAFWAVLLYLGWPHKKSYEQYILYIALALVLYAIAISGRRSAYVAWIVGFSILLPLVFVVSGTQKLKLIAPVLATIFILWLYVNIAGNLPGGTFFVDRIGMIGDRFQDFTADLDEPAGDNFAILQRQGMIAAFTDHPILGVGWGGFHRSPYSPTGHEMHSTPQKFIAELGLVGISLYIALMGYLIFGSIRLFYWLRDTPYALSAAIMIAAWCSLTVSHVYNRSFTDRTFYLMLAIFLGFELFAREYRQKNQSRPHHHR